MHISANFELNVMQLVNSFQTKHSLIPLWLFYESSFGVEWIIRRECL